MWGLLLLYIGSIYSGSVPQMMSHRTKRVIFFWTLTVHLFFILFSAVLYFTWFLHSHCLCILATILSRNLRFSIFSAALFYCMPVQGGILRQFRGSLLESSMRCPNGQNESLTSFCAWDFVWESIYSCLGINCWVVWSGAEGECPGLVLQSWIFLYGAFFGNEQISAVPLWGFAVYGMGSEHELMGVFWKSELSFCLRGRSTNCTVSCCK